MAPKTAKYVINTDTNFIFPYKESYLTRENFKPFYDDPPPVDRTTGVCMFREKLDPLVAIEEQKREIEIDIEEGEKHEALIDAMFKMVKMDFATSNGMPTLSHLEKVVGFKVSKEMRLLAFDEFKLRKEVGEGR